MYFDFEDHRPETPRFSSAISAREGVLVSIILHLSLVILVLLFPGFLSWGESPEEMARLEPRTEEPLRYVEVVPLADLPPLINSTDQDLDRDATTVERAPDAANPMPLMRGNTPEMVDGGPAAEPAPPSVSAAPPADATPLPMEDPSGRAVFEQPVPAATPAIAPRSLADSLRNLDRYLQEDRFDNSRGGNVEQSADIQFDSKGVDFGPWLRRFKNQVQRNWIVPASVMTFRGRVVIQFNVHRDGRITDLAVVQPASIPALTTAALNALKLSNPTTQLPPEYPTDRVFFTVTFFYNEDPRAYR
jgi:TonB family protein